MASLDIIIVNWNAGEYLRRCLESIAGSDPSGVAIRRVCVVDNASNDGSAANLGNVKLPLIVMRNIENRGFASACNQGAEGSGADFLLFLNPDTSLTGESLSRPIRFMEREENQSIGVVGVQLLDEHGTVARSCARFPTPSGVIGEMLGLSHLFPRVFPSHFMHEWDHRSSREVDQVMGAFFLVRRRLFESLGGFDERFFVYYEDVDFSYRIRQAGSRSYFLSEAAAFHKGKATTDSDKAARLTYVLRSRILFGFKHFGWLAARTILLVTLLVEPLFRFGWILMKRTDTTISQTAKGYAGVWRVLPQLLRMGGERKE